MQSYKQIICGAVFPVIASLVALQNIQAQSTLKCRAADDRTVSLIAQLKAWATTTDSERISQREDIFHVPVVDAKSLTVVTDEKLCAKIIAGYAAFPKLAYAPARVYVIRLGSKGYAAYDPDKKGGEFTAVHIFNTKCVRVGGWAG
jgi:hypothetical protein